MEGAPTATRHPASHRDKSRRQSPASWRLCNSPRRRRQILPRPTVGEFRVVRIFRADRAGGLRVDSRKRQQARLRGLGHRRSFSFFLLRRFGGLLLQIQRLSPKDSLRLRRSLGRAEASVTVFSAASNAATDPGRRALGLHELTMLTARTLDVAADQLLRHADLLPALFASKLDHPAALTPINCISSSSRTRAVGKGREMQNA